MANRTIRIKPVFGCIRKHKTHLNWGVGFPGR
jgi:hypothetical protein